MPAISFSGRSPSSISRIARSARSASRIVGEAGAAFGQMPVNGPPVAGQVLGHPFDRAVAAWQQRANQFADLVVPVAGPYRRWLRRACCR